MSIKIRKAKKEDFNQYLELRKESLKEYSNIVGKKIILSDLKIKKEFNEIFSSSKRFLLVSENKKEINGFLMGTLLNSIWQKSGYLDDIFVSNKVRKKGVGKLLIKEFMRILKLKKAKTLRLGVNPKNKTASKMYKKLGFETIHHEMEKKII